MNKSSLVFDYLILLTASVFFLIFLRFFQGERLVSFLVTLSFVSFYILWGIYHHAKEETLHMKNVLEYIFIGFAVLLLLIAIISF